MIGAASDQDDKSIGNIFIFSFNNFEIVLLKGDFFMGKACSLENLISF